ncbi:hypothetical protein C1X35_19115 [Pseudomonas sp. FW306-1C-G01A]|uniref:hypothetical protein n=1 Tax=unclassified Pseudomonas TaxID=196821 RepID=UPI000C868E29|nr:MULTISPECIES: hypothetical protein [unclassified Pseudomonas]PMV86712.1 hypothetical protein C1X56_13765 [Pseudomonas sp. GW101-1A09]PMV94469.1 hypothetical protein C1X51_12415 [Pseudomonas sp. FW306-2-2C-B10A]PMW04367.1 hypothetical protein C1X50_18080 [Pseudomonas sp. MPR-TSA4]PMW11450.1 hypothetical protein C1X52_21125 [Pseudomonas sp. FW306-2-1A-C05A]PMW33343.1 hypothetical protein C1X48_22735 [Pseudomonas sp. FW305-3-2-15-A-R2A1]
MIKGIEGILAFALMGMAIGGVIGGRDSVAELFQPEWFTPVVSSLYAGCNILALWALVQSAESWEIKAMYALALIGAWFSPALVVVLGNDPEPWMSHMIWGFMLCVPVAIIVELKLRKRGKPNASTIASA